MSAMRSDTPAATQPEIPSQDVANAAPDAGKSPAGASPEPQEPKSFFSQPKPKAEPKGESLPDISKLPPDMQKLAKSFQADYTTKTQAAAEEKRQVELERAAIKAERDAMQRNHDALIEALKGRNAPAEAPNAPPDPMAQVRALREEGRSDEADQLLVKIAQDAMQAQLAPEKERQASEQLKTTFQSTAMDVINQNPLVAEYKADVVKVFDARNPMMDQIRADILSSPDLVKRYVPVFLNAIATEIHAKKTEAERDALRHELAELKAGMAKAKARSVPSSLLNVSSRANDSAPTRHGSLKAALEAAAEKMANGSN